jgi:hypothetical protein
MVLGPAPAIQGIKISPSRRITLRACDRSVVIECDEDDIADFVFVAFGGLHSPTLADGDPGAVRYRVHREPCGAFRVVDAEQNSVLLDDPDDVLFHIDKCVSIALQRLRADLFFLHAAVVARGGYAVVVPAPSGTGKSTLALALLSRGFSYLSDELAPIDLTTFAVNPFRHAVCLKSTTRHRSLLPAATLRTGERYHVPPSALGGSDNPSSQRVGAFVFLERHSTGRRGCSVISVAETVARLMSNALNPAAHANQGVDAAMALAQRIRGFTLNGSDLELACSEIERVFVTAMHDHNSRSTDR